MAYKKYGKKYRRRPYRKARYSKTKKMVTGHGPTLLEQISKGVGSVAKLATAVVPLAAAINTEEKFNDDSATITTYGVNSNPNLTCLTSGISQGTDESDRIGNSILFRNLQVRLAVSMPVDHTATPPVVGCHHRVLFFVWKENEQQNPPTIAKLLQDPTNMYSPVNKDNSDSFVIMKDKHMQLNAASTTTKLTTECFRTFKYFKKLQWHARYTGPDGNNERSQNHVWMLTMSSAPSSAYQVGTTYYRRVNYTDN